MAIKLERHAVEGALTCAISATAFGVSELTAYRQQKGDGKLQGIWMVVIAEGGYLLLFAAATIEGVARVAIGCIAVCFGKGTDDTVYDMCWLGAGYSFDAALRAFVALGKNLSGKQFTYEDLLITGKPFTVGPSEKEQRAALNNDIASTQETFNAQPKGLFEPEEEEIEEDEGTPEDLFCALSNQLEEFKSATSVDPQDLNPFLETATALIDNCPLLVTQEFIAGCLALTTEREGEQADLPPGFNFVPTP